MSVHILNASDQRQGPIGAEELKTIIEKEITDWLDIKVVPQNVAHKLSNISSKHKFLVLVTRIDQNSEIDSDMSIKSVLGTVWDDQKDGFWSLRVDDEASIHLVTVYWIEAS